MYLVDWVLIDWLIDFSRFLGHSYLVHETGLEDNSTLELGLRTHIGFWTTYSTGVLFYTRKQGGLLITSFLEDGILNFQVSCGHQLITFSDSKHRVNTGYEQTLEVVVTFQGEKGLDRTCITEIHLKGTHAMKGGRRFCIRLICPSTFISFKI